MVGGKKLGGDRGVMTVALRFCFPAFAKVRIR